MDAEEGSTAETTTPKTVSINVLFQIVEGGKSFSGSVNPTDKH